MSKPSTTGVSIRTVVPATLAYCVAPIHMVNALSYDSAATCVIAIALGPGSLISNERSRAAK